MFKSYLPYIHVVDVFIVFIEWCLASCLLTLSAIGLDTDIAIAFIILQSRVNYLSISY